MSPILNARERHGLQVGQRDTPVEIESMTTDGVDDSGFPDPNNDDNWDTLVEREWMRRESASGRERHESLQTSAPVDTVWIMGYRADMDPDLVDVAKLRRLRCENRRFDITFAEVLGRKDGIRLETVSRVG